mgnify:CR=1 FL=1
MKKYHNHFYNVVEFDDKIFEYILEDEDDIGIESDKSVGSQILFKLKPSASIKYIKIIVFML